MNNLSSVVMLLLFVAVTAVPLFAQSTGVITNVEESIRVACTTGDPVRCTFRDDREFDGHVWVRVLIDTSGIHTTTARIVHLDGMPDTNPSNDVATHTLEALALPSVAVISSTGGPIEPGNPVAFSVTLRNLGITPATNVAFALTLPAGGTVVTGAPRGGVADCAIQNNTLVCTKASLLQGEIVQVNVTVTAPLRTDGEDLVIEIVETQAEQDVDPSDNRRTLRAVMVRHFVVANVEDEGTGSLRQAIHDVNALCPITRPCALLFQISEHVPAKGWFTIQPRTPLPEIVASLRIDGLAQTNYSGDTNPEGPEIEINGELVSERSGLVVRPNCNVDIRGLAVNGFPGYGIEVRRGSDTCFTDALIRENYLGTDPRGRTAKPNQRGLGIFTIESHVFVNLISGNQRSGIYVEDGAFHQIGGNRIGVGADGSPLGNGAGIFINMGNLFVDFIGADITHNVIAYNHGMAIARTRRGEILISKNSIFDNLQQGIDVGVDGPTPQRADDTDVPNAPMLFSATYDPWNNATIVRGRIDSEAYGSSGASGQPPRSIEVFASARLSIWAEPQAETSLAIASLLTGHEHFEVVVLGDFRGKWITATYTVAHSLGQVRYDPRGPASESHREGSPADTSELSNAVMVQ